MAVASHTPKGLRTPKAAGIPPLLWLSLALVPLMLTETITPSHPVAGDRSVRLGPCTTRHLARARERSKSWASKDAQLWHNGLQGWRSRDALVHPGPPPWQYAVKGTLCRALSSAGHPRTSKEAAWYQRGTQGSLVGNQEIPGNFSEHSGDPW